MRKLIYAFYILATFCISLAGWEQIYDWGDGDYATDIIHTVDSDAYGYILAGYTYSFSSDGYPDGFILKLDDDGNIIWSHFYYVEDGQWFTSVVALELGYIAAGYQSIPGGGEEIYVVKTDVEGNVDWERTYSLGSYQEANDLVYLPSDELVIIVGYTELESHDMLVMCVDVHDGDTLWTRTFGGDGWDVANAVVPTNDNPDEFIVVGYKEVNLYTDEDFWAIRMNADGDTLWSKTYGGSSWDEAYDIASVGENYIIAGKTQSFGEGSYDIWAVCIDNSGDTLWTSTYGDESFDGANAVIPIDSTRAVLTGFTTDSLSRNILWLKLSAENGSILMTKTFGSDSTTDEGTATIMSNDDNCDIIIAGSVSETEFSSNDVIIVRTDTLGNTAIEERDFFKPDNLDIEVFPNPFNSSVRITIAGLYETENLFQYPVKNQKTDIKIYEIYDIQGNVVCAPLTHLERAGGNMEFTWTPKSSIPSGVYFVQVKTKDATRFVRKIVFLR